MVKRLEWDACDAHGCHCDIVESKDGDMVSYEDYAALKKERDALMKLHELAYNEPNNDEAMHWVNQAINNLENWTDD